VSTIGAMETSEALREITATVVFFDDLNGISAERAVGFAVVGFVMGLELVPTLVDDLPKRGSSGPARMINSRHNCLIEHLKGTRSKLFIYAVAVIR